MEFDLEEFLEQEGFEIEGDFSELIEQDDRDSSELLDDARNSLGAKIDQEITSLYATLEIVNKNFEDLEELRDVYMEHAPTAWKSGNRDLLEKFQIEYLRFLHNYTASVHSLISHSYTILDRYEDDKPELKEGYFREIDSRDLSAKVDFLKQVRHYTQKRELPTIMTTKSVEQVSEDEVKTDFSILLNKEEMMDWDGWDAQAKEKLKEWDEELDMTVLAEEYQEEVNDFFEWFYEYIRSVFSEELKEHYITIYIVSEQLDLEEKRLS